MCEMMTVVLADDDVTARRDLRAALERYETEHDGRVRFEIREYESGEALLAAYRSDVDVVMLDVEMGDLDGFDTARTIRERDPDVSLLFVTNMAQYAIRGYEVDALSYLLKPVNYHAFTREMDRCVARRVVRDAETTLTFTTAGGVARVPVRDVTYLECVRHKIIVHTVDGAYEFTGTLKSFIPQLEPLGFAVANSCYLVNLRYVTAVDRTTCRMRDDTQLAVSRRRRPSLLQAVADYITAA